MVRLHSLPSSNITPLFAAKRNVLVVDEYKDARDAYKLFLKEAWPGAVNPNDTVNVTCVGTREEAEGRLARSNFDLVVTGNKISPKGGGGLDLIRNVRKSTPNNPMVVMVTVDPNVTEDQVKEAGGDSFFRAGFGFAPALLDKLRERFGEKVILS